VVFKAVHRAVSVAAGLQNNDRRRLLWSLLLLLESLGQVFESSDERWVGLRLLPEVVALPVEPSAPGHATNRGGAIQAAHSIKPLPPGPVSKSFPFFLAGCWPSFVHQAEFLVTLTKLKRIPAPFSQGRTVHTAPGL
jgi:hypothetical protein